MSREPSPQWGDAAALAALRYPARPVGDGLLLDALAILHHGIVQRLPRTVRLQTDQDEGTPGQRLLDQHLVGYGKRASSASVPGSRHTAAAVGRRPVGFTHSA